MPRQRPTDVAIIGMACIFPGAGDLGSFWRNILGGVDAISAVPANRWEPVFYDPDARRPDRLYCRRGGFVDEYAYFDTLSWGIMPVAVSSIEPDQLLALDIAAAALADADYRDRPFPRERTGVVLGRGGYLNPVWTRLTQTVRTSQELVNCVRKAVPGVTDEQIESLRAEYLKRVGHIGPDNIIGLVPNLAASRIANRLDLQGASYTVDAACASSLIAVERACLDLAEERSDLVLAGGVHITHDPAFWSVFCQLGALSPKEMIRPFDRRADGLLIGEGVGIVVLKRLADAERDDDRIWAVLRGAGSASDGRESSLMVPRVAGQVLALQRAWQMAGLDPRRPDAVGLIEAHGTATPAGDAAELGTLARFFGPAEDGRRHGLGSVKSMIGHAMPAAGIAGLIKAALAVHDGVLPPTLHCDEPHPGLEATRFRPLREAEPWESQTPRRAAVNAFGFGGINAHVVLEQHAPPTRRPLRDTAARRPALLLAADTPAGLLAALTTGRSLPGGGPCRLAILDPTPERVARARAIVERGQPFHGRKEIWFSPMGLLAGGGKLAFLFPGVDADFTPRVEDVERRFGRRDYSEALARFTSGDLQDTGVGIVQVSRLLDGVLRELGLVPDLAAGHSIGEWAAMIATGILPAAAVDRFLAELPPAVLRVPGLAFAAVGAGREKVEEALGDLPEVAVSHDNCPHQVILCGRAESVDAAVERLLARGVLTQKLAFQSGFHSPFFSDYVDGVRRGFDALPLAAARYPLWSATTCSPYPTDEAAIRELFVRHLVQPVRFRELLARLYDTGTRVFVQVGTGSLVGFVDDSLRDQPHLAISANSPRRDGMRQLERLLAALWVEGAEADVERLLAPAASVGLGNRLRLELGAPLVELEDPPHLGGGVARPAAATGDPVLDEFAASLRALERGQQDVLDAWRHDAATPAPAAARQLSRRRRISLADCPYLVDHSFFRQPPGWPEPSDRFVTVPATMSIGMMVAAAQELADAAGGGRVVVGLEAVRARRWIEVPAEGVEIEVEAELAAPDRVATRIGDFIEATAILAAAYPEPPAPDRRPLDNERASPITEREMYDLNWTFHGPQYQAVREIRGYGDDGFRAVLEALPAEGCLFDAATQLLGVWIGVSSDVDRMAFPVGAERVTFYGPPPAVGTLWDCLVRIRRYGKSQVRADFELVRDGRLWLRAEGWTDQRFETDDRLWTMIRFPEENLLATPHAAVPDCCELAKGFSTIGMRDLMARRFLTPAERAEWTALDPRRQVDWLSGRIAAKDAVRHRLWTDGHGPIFPIEIELRAGAGGVLEVATPYAGELHVSIAHKGGAAVARVGVGNPVGIDLETIEARDEAFAEAAFAPAELALLAGRGGGRDEWITRGWAAKEAVAKLRGTGLGGKPRAFRLTAVDGERLEVEGVEVATLRQGDAIVAWTTSPAPETAP